MTNAFYVVIQRFGRAVDMENILIQNIEIHLGAILVIAFLSCFFGLKIIRLWSAVMAFFLMAIAICELLREITHMGVIVITFTVIGLITAFIVYHWYKLSIFLLSVMVGYSLVAVFTSNIWICFGGAIVLGVLSIFFSPLIVMLSTAIWGGVTLSFEGLSYMNIFLPDMGMMLEYKIAAATLLTATGLFIQYSMNKTHLTTPAQKQKFERNVAMTTYSTER